MPINHRGSFFITFTGDLQTYSSGATLLAAPQ